MFIFPLVPFWEVVAGRSHHCVWLEALDAHWALLWIVLVAAGITIVPSESGGTGWHPSAHTRLFVFPPPLVEWS
jgi:hypothetical protein